MSVRLRQWTNKEGDVEQRWTIDVKVRIPGEAIRRVRDFSPVNSRRGAEQHERLVRQALLDGVFGKEVKEIPTLAKFTARFLDHARTNNKHSTVRSKVHMLNKHILPAFGPNRLNDISTARIEAFKVRLLAKKLSKKSVNNVLTCLGRLLNLASDWGELEDVPKIQWLKAPKPGFDFLTYEEADQLVAGAEAGRWQTMIVVALNTGLRIGELCGLQWKDVDLNAGRLMVRRRVYRGELDTPKGGRGREIPLNDRAIAVLKAWKVADARLPWVFTQREGGFIRNPQHACEVAIRRCAEAAGLQHETRSIGWHTLRHSFASHLVMAGVPLKSVQELLGHATISMTERYAHLSPHVNREAVRALDAPRRGTSGAQNDVSRSRNDETH